MDIKERLNLLREKMKENNIDVYYFNTSDYHLSEYVAKYFKTIQYFSNFSGSLATLLVDLNNAYIFIDGRYHQQADKQCGIYGIQVIKLGTIGALEPLQFIKENYLNKTIGFDGKRTSINFAREIEKIDIKINTDDIYSSIIENREPLNNDKLWLLEDKYSGKSCKDKINEVKEYLNNRSLVINNLESIAYLLNLRGNDIVYTPVFYSYLLINEDKTTLFVKKERLDDSIKEYLVNSGVNIEEYEKYYQVLNTISGKDILLDFNKVNYLTYQLLQKNNNLINEISIVEIIKSKKNEIEIANSKLAHLYDGVAMVKFLKWIKNNDNSKINEVDVVNYLNKCRLSYKAFDLSFEPIVAYNANGAMMHYGPTINNCSQLDNKGILLIDSGGQYLQGTTDITRTIALGEVNKEIKKHFTLVLKSMFNLSSLVFLHGLTGRQIDVVARKDLWEIGIDYRCGTGHGVGQVSSVHENPPNIRYGKGNGSEEMILEVGNIVSDEPGVYIENEYGIRCENMLLVVPYLNNEYGQFLKFETLTLCPFDLDLIDKEYLDNKTIDLLNQYHKMVNEKLAPYLDEDEKEFLKKITREI